MDKRRTTVIYRPYFTAKDGRKIWAKWFGKKAFRFEIDPDQDFKN